MAELGARPRIDQSGPVRLEDLGLSNEQLAEIGVSMAQRGVRTLEELGREPRPDLRRLAKGDPDLVAAFVAKHLPNGRPDAA